MAQRKPRTPPPAAKAVTVAPATFASVAPPPEADSFDVMVGWNNYEATVETFAGTKRLARHEFARPTFLTVQVPVGRWNQYFHGDGWNGPFPLESYAGAPHVLSLLLNGSPAQPIGYRFSKPKPK